MNKTQSFELKGSLLTLTVLYLLTPDLSLLSAQLKQKTEATPNLFKRMPIVIDLERLKRGDSIDFPTLLQQLRQYGLIPVGIRNASPSHRSAAQEAQLPILSSTTALASKPPSTNTPQTDAVKLITKPVRSGQQVYAKQANLVILASVSHGAEVLADGYIHVYGQLRGRALAGVTGNENARIFCSGLDAELLSIAGHYKIREDLPCLLDQGMKQIYLDQKRLCIEALST